MASVNLRVLVVTPGYPVPDNPSAAGFVHRQIREMARQGVRCKVLTYRPAPPRFPRWVIRRNWVKYYYRSLFWPRTLDGIPVETVFYDRRWVKDEDTVPAISDALIRFLENHPEWRETDILYSHWLWTGGAVALRLREKFGWPVATIARGSELHDWHSVQPHCRGHVKQVLEEAEVILANCQDLRQRAEALVPGSGSRMGVVYNGCDSTRFKPAENRDAIRAELGHRPENRIAVFCGEIIQRKGIVELTEAWQSFAHRRASWKLLLLGKVVEPLLAEDLKRKCGQNVQFLGSLPQEQIIRHLQAADAFVLPSRLEGLANAAMEAMGVGLPIITTATCGQVELIQNHRNGWIVPPKDSTALGEALEEMATNPARAWAYGKAARETLVNTFDPISHVANLIQLLGAEVEKRNRLEMAVT